MPDGRNNRRQQRQLQERSQENQLESLLFGVDDEPLYNYPRTNQRLSRAADQLESRFTDQLGMVASEVTTAPDRTLITIEGSEEPYRTSERVLANELPTLGEINSESVSQEQSASSTRLIGEMPLSVRTALLIDNGQSGPKARVRALAFRRAEHDWAGRGQSGAVGPAERAPGQQSRREISQEYFMVGKQAGKEVVVTVGDKNTSPAIQRRRIAKAVDRIAQPIKKRLEIMRRSPGQSRESMKQATEQLAYLMKHRPIVALNEQPRPELEQKMPLVETKINGETERVRGYVTRGPGNMVNVIRPVAVNPAEQGVDPDSLVVMDATGLNRPVRAVEQPSEGLTDDLNRILEGLDRFDPIQDEDGSVVLKPSLEAQILRSPLAVPPQF